MKLHRFGSTVALAAVASLTLAACGEDNPTGSAGPTEGGSAAEGEGAAEQLSGTLGGAGASSQTAAMTAWQAGYQDLQPEVTVNYDPVGSGAGREQFLAGAVPFAGSDAYLDDQEMEAAVEVCGPDGAINLPVYISPIAIPFNLEGVDTLDLAPDVLAAIFDQEITTWDDPAIAADNPDADLPGTEITVVNRSDDSGTTENFLEYLSAAAPDAWPHEPDDAWPVDGGEAANGTSGVIEVVSTTDGAIGYADASATGQLSTAAIGVGPEFVEFSEEAAAAVVDASEPTEGRGESDLAIELARDTTESGTYPIVLVSYHVACMDYEDASQGELVKSFLSYVVSSEGQSAANEAAGSAPISEDLRGRAQDAIDAITAG